MLRGVTSGTTAKVTSQHGLIYDNLQRYFGGEGAEIYATANEKAISHYRDLIKEKEIDCDWEDVDAYIYSTEDSLRIEQEAKAAQSVGIKAEFTDKTELPFEVKAAVRFPNQGKFHPLKFLAALAKELTIYENVRVKEVNDGEVIYVPHQPQRSRKRRVPGHDVRHRRWLGPRPICLWPLSRPNKTGFKIAMYGACTMRRRMAF